MVNKVVENLFLSPLRIPFAFTRTAREHKISQSRQRTLTLTIEN